MLAVIQFPQLNYSCPYPTQLEITTNFYFYGSFTLSPKENKKFVSRATQKFHVDETDVRRQTFDITIANLNNFI